jgi:RNA polymerase subunit RPABC4/transcription elongation factor Spt4
MKDVGEVECLECPDCGIMAEKETNFCTYCGADNRGAGQK